MSQPIGVPARPLFERVRTAFGRRAAGIVLALFVELLLGLLFLTLAPSITRRKEVEMAVFSFNRKADAPAQQQAAAPAPEPAETRPEPSASDPQPSERAEAQPSAPRPARQQPVEVSTVPLPALIRLSPQQMAAADIATMAPRSPAATTRRRTMGPPDTGTPGDSPRVDGAGPNGEPLYAASWYRKPYDDELRGFLSTARGPGWGLIACRTVRDFRVEDCVIVDEYPDGSNIARSVLAAAWQFRVRPPQIGGQYRIGEWVRIRIDYETGGRAEREGRSSR